MRNYPTKNYATRRGVYRNCAATLLLLLCCYFSNSQVNYLKLPKSAPRTINGSSNLVIENQQFTNMSGNNLTILNSSNITVRNCYFGVSSGIGVELENCTNITIENCFFANNKSGVYATSCSGIKVNNNQFINAQGPFPRGQFVQFNTVNGSGNSVSGNRGECYRGESYAEDLVNMYRTSGTSSSPVTVANNYFRGGGPSPSGGGLMSGDFDGGWVIVENNTLVFPGNYGVAMAGGNNIILRNNTIYSDRKPWTNVGMYTWAQQGASCSNVTVTGNKVTWTHKDGFSNPFWDGGNCGPINWSCCNTSGQSLASMNVPNVIVNCVTEDELWQVREDSRHFVVNVTVREMPPWLPRPTANAGADKSVTGTTTTLTGGGGNTYRWVQVSGPNNATVTNANSANATLSGLVNGTYNFRLEAYDAEGASDADWIIVTVTNSQPAPNTPPVANTNANITITLPTNTATLNGSTSTDADGTIESYQWAQVSGPNTATIANANQAVANLSDLIEGTYTFRLTVTDDDNATGTKTVNVTVNPAPNQSPVADAGVNAVITLPVAIATLDGSQSSDPDGTIASYQWTQVSGPSTSIIANANQSVALLSSLIEGVYTFRLRVTDNDGATDDETVNVTVNPLLPVPNQAPVSNAGANITITLPVNTATLNGSQSTDADGTIETYQWTQVNGPNTATIANANQASANLSGLAEGVYTFRLTVTDDDGGTDTDDISVTVNAAVQPPNQVPVANAGANIAITLPVSTATLNGSQSTDADGTIESYQWTQLNGPNTSTIANGNQAGASLSGLVQGAYTFRLTVTDDDGGTDTDDVTVTVNAAVPAPNQVPVANAGANIAITLPVSTATLNGSQSSDADGTIASYQWTRVSGPNTPTVTNADQATASLSGLVQGTYTFRLTVTDNDGGTDTDDVTVTVNAAVPPPNQVPVANAGANIAITLPVSTTTLNGTQSSDADGTIASYQWTRVSGPNTPTVTNADQATASLSGLVQGTYTFRLTVTDDDGGTDTDDVTVTVSAAAPQNQLPIANAGANITITLPVNTATLNGTQSSDADGTIASYQWTRVSGPNTPTITNADQATASLSGLVQGTYNFRLTVTDDDGGTDADDVTVTVNAAVPPPNQVPVANAGANIAITLSVSTATLNGTQSSDADGTIASYQWTRVSGPNTPTIANADQATASLSGLVQGTYTFRLTVTDNDGATDIDDVIVTVNAAVPPPNQLPVANAGANITITLPANTTTLNGTQSSDADGTIASYQWTRVAGPNTPTIANADQATASLSGLVQGAYTFRLTVTDNDGSTDTDDVMVIVNAAVPPPNQLPVANAGANITITLPVNTAALNGTQSNDPDGTIASYQWTQVAGPNTATIANANQVRPTVSGLIQGVYTFRLTVRDNDGGTATDAVNVTVNPVPNQLPLASAGANITITLPVNTTVLNGTQSSDPDGSIASYQWAQVSGPNTATIANANQARPTVSGLVQGVYTFRLTVRDNDGGTATDAVNVTVNPAPNQLPVANAGANIAITLPANTSALNGSQSTDPDGTIAAYQWTQVSGPNTATITNANQAGPNLSGLVQGTYTFRLAVRDNDGGTDTDDVIVTVSAAPLPNQLPVANAGANITITLPVNTAALNGSQSNDPDGTIASYQWTQVSGPNTATIANANQARPTLSGLAQGTYTFRLTVRDNDNAADNDDVIVTVNEAPNNAPVANAGANITVTLPISTASLNGSQSRDPDGTIASHQWRQISGPNTAIIANGNQVRPTVSGLTRGTYTFRLTVRDNDNAADIDDVVVVVNDAPNTAPVANAGANIVITLPVNTATLSGTGSADTDGTIASYQWAQASGPNTATIANANQATTGVSGLVQGTYTFRLTIRDNDGATATATVTVTVSPAATNKAPIANAGLSQATTLSSNEATLNGTLSRDPDGVITSYQWVQISGPSTAVIAAPAAATTRISGFSEGDYVFQLTVKDNSNATAMDTVTIAVVNNFRAFANDLMLYPNPATDQVNLILYNDKYSKAIVNVYDLTARKVLTPIELTNTQNRFTTTIDITRLKPGAYIVEIVMDNRKKVTTKFVKQ